MNLHEVYMAAQLAAENGGNSENLSGYAKKSDLPILISESEFAEFDTNTYPTDTIFMIWGDSE